MISVCIPVYNHVVVPLADELIRQSSLLKAEVELVFIDDCSTDEYRNHNLSLEDKGNYILLDHNVGRSRIRNLFLEHAKGDYLIFIDNDVKVPEKFLANYVATLSQSPSVVVGGIRYGRRPKDDAYALRYQYGSASETRSAAIRSRHPYRSFMTGNFMIRTDLLRQYPFDETITGYGHEDTMMGYTLGQHQVPILHIDNPVICDYLETNDVFLNKSCEAVANLVALYRVHFQNEAFCHSVRLVETYLKLAHAHLTGIVEAAFKLLRRPLRSHFLAGSATSVAEFNFYKLGLFCTMLSDSKSSRT